MNVVFAYLLAFLVIVVFFKLIRIVPEQEAYVIEKFGKYQTTLGSGLHLIIPFIQQVAYKHILKEEVLDVDPQVCITSDNVQVTVDGLLYLRVMDPEKASYGIDNYRYATAQLAKTTMRSEIGKLELDRTFSERDEINDAIVKALDEASDPWGIKVTRYEIKDISPTETIEKAMEQQMRAEREKRAGILASEGEKSARINISKGERQSSINLSKGERQKRINESEGRARAIEITSEATAEGLTLVAEALKLPKGKSAMSLRLAEQYIEQFGSIIETAETSVLPDDLARLKSLIDTVTPSLGGSRPHPASGSQSVEGGKA
jgi:regulator of protease activity HflC (stomatin/prohibitin superfamily)